MVKFWSQIYKSWNPTNKIMFWLALTGSFTGIFFGGKYILNINTNKNIVQVQNSTLMQSPIVVDSSNVDITYDSYKDSDILNPFFYKYELEIKNIYLTFGKKMDLYNIKVILPDNQEAFIEKLIFNKTYKISACNEESTECYIYHKFRIKDDFKDEDFCVFHTTRFGHEDMASDTQEFTNRFFNEPDKCKKIIE